MSGLHFNDPRLPDRFWRKCIPEPMSGCWLWIGGLQSQGYGRVYVFSEDSYTHIVTYSITNGFPPRRHERTSNGDRLELDHRCRTRSCCNPDHLELVTHGVNIRRGANGAAKTHCKEGHELSGDNLFVRKPEPGNRRGRGRECRICHCRKVVERKKATRAEARLRGRA